MADVGNLQKEKIKKPEVIYVNKEAEDIRQKQTFGLPPVSPLEMPEEMQSNVLKDETASILVKKELKRRMDNVAENGGQDPELDFMKKAMKEGRHLDVEQRAEKAWISRSMEKLRTDKRQKMKRELEEAERQRREQKERHDYAKAHSKDAHGKRLRSGIRKARNKIGYNTEMDRLEYIPKKTLLLKEFKGAFTNKLDDRKRAEKKLNKRSRLFQKIKNAEVLKKIVEKEQRSQYEEMRKLVDKQKMPISKEDFNDLSQFMVKGDDEFNLSLIKKYLGESDKEGLGGKQGQDVQEALDIMAESLFEFDISSLNFQTDADMVRNADTLERLSKRVAAFDRMADKHDFMASLNKQEWNILTEKLNALRAIAAYYNIRKEIINDRYYQDHYNEELSMDTDAATNDEQRAIGEKLVKSYILGRTMMRVNGVDISRINSRGGIPDFAKNDAVKKRKYDEMRADLRKIIRQREMTGSAYVQSDAVAEASLNRTAFAKKKAENEKKAERERSRQDMAEKATENVLAYKGIKRLISKKKDAPYDEEKLKEKVEKLKNLDVKKVKFGSYREMIQNFAANNELCEQAEDIHYELVRGLQHGFELPDIDAMQIRAKLQFFHSVRCTMWYINNELAKNKEGFNGKTEEEWAAKLKEHFGKGDGLVLLPGDPEELYKKCWDKVENEYGSMEKNIRDVWKFIDPNDPPGPIPEEELRRRKGEYQKNAIIAEFLSRENDNTFHLSPVGAIIKGYCNKNGLADKQLLRIQYNAMEGLPADEIIRLYKLATGSPAEQFQFWKEADGFSRSVPIKDFDTRSMAGWFDNFYEKQRVSRIGTNLKDITDGMKKIYEKKNHYGWLKLPEHYKNADEMAKEGNFKNEFFCGYITGRLDCLMQMPTGAGRYVLSLEEMGGWDEKHRKRILDRITEAEMDIHMMEAENFEEMRRALSNSVNFLTQAVTSKPITREEEREGKLQKKATFDMDIEELYEEERRFAFNPEYNQEAEKNRNRYNDAIAAFDKKTDKTKRVKANLSKLGNITNCMMFFEKGDKRRAVSFYDRITKDNAKATARERKQKREELEKVFKQIADFDLSLFNFEKPSELLSNKYMDARIMGVMMWDFSPAVFVKDYEALRDNFPDAGCNYDAEMMKEITDKITFIQSIFTWFNEYPKLREPGVASEFNAEELLKLSEKDLIKKLADEQVKDDEEKKLTDGERKKKYERYQSLITIVHSRDAFKFGPGVDANELFKKWRKKEGA